MSLIRLLMAQAPRIQQQQQKEMSMLRSLALASCCAALITGWPWLTGPGRSGHHRHEGLAAPAEFWLA
jgi:hypothetical protein